MKVRNSRNARGFTLLEYIIAMSILMITGVMVASVFVSFNREQVLVTETDSIVTLLSEARSKTLYSQNAARFGVHFGTSSVTQFQGSAYALGDPNNVVVNLNSLVTIATTSLSGGTSDIIFDRLTGNVSATGTITVALVSSATSTHIIQVLGTGIAERIR